MYGLAVQGEVWDEDTHLGIIHVSILFRLKVNADIEGRGQRTAPWESEQLLKKAEDRQTDRQTVRERKRGGERERKKKGGIKKMQ